jgi:murein DD-endopeptidase MepM/ murein hydrolase activator NlpD
VPTVPDLPSAAKPVDAPVVEVKTIRSNSGHPKAIATKKALAPTAPVKEAGGKVIAGLLFPLEERPQVSYKSGGRNFGANRAGGRKHAGIDLYAPVGTPVRAMADGKVLQVYQFYLGTWVIEVDHGSFIARYGEVKQTNIRVKVNEEVTRGQVLGQVGKLQGLKASMLHLEMYSSTKSPKD